MRTEIAERYGIETYSDLAKADDELIFGAEYDFFERADGYDALCETYGLNFGSTMDLDLSLIHISYSADVEHKYTHTQYDQNLIG